MNNNLYRVIVVLVFLFFSCTKKNEENIKTIKVKVEDRYSKGNFEDYFSSSVLVPLETNENSILGRIDRISFFDDKFFILDKTEKSIVIFNKQGKYINRIKNIGNGPGEYGHLMDFAVDNIKKQLILTCFRPSKILTYSYEGKFIEEISTKLRGFYPSLGYINEKLLFLNKARGKLFLDYDLISKEKKSYIEMEDFDKYFSRVNSRFPSIVKSNNDINIALSYSDLIYSYKEGSFYPKYRIDFGKNALPKNTIKKFQDNYPGFSDYIKDKNYGYGVSNFRENKNYITFNFWKNGIVIYSKKLNEAKAFMTFQSANNHFFLGNYIAHDGNTNSIFSIYRADTFKRQMDYFSKDSTRWNQLPNYVKSIDKNIKDTDNPILHIYEFK